jgi:hypothetical protein
MGEEVRSLHLSLYPRGPHLVAPLYLCVTTAPPDAGLF